jgi:LysM repeat protein
MARALACSLSFALISALSSAEAAPPAPSAPALTAAASAAASATAASATAAPATATAADGLAAPVPEPARERLAELLGLAGGRSPIVSSPRFVAIEQRELRASRLLVGFLLPAGDVARFEALASALSGAPGRLGELAKQRRLSSVVARVEVLYGSNVLAIELEAAPGGRARELEEAMLSTLFELVRAQGADTTRPSESAREWLRAERRAVVELHPKERYFGTTKRRGPSQHRVERGDTLSEIAERYGLDLETMVKVNQLEPDRPIRPGDRIQLSTRRAPLPKLYVVKPGDTLSKVAKRYGVSQKALQDANRLRDRKVRAGQKLVLPH